MKDSIKGFVKLNMIFVVPFILVIAPFVITDLLHKFGN